jgi:anaerobic sulfite reductase subunit B
MLNHIPDSIELVDYVDDGEQARHYRFRILPSNKGNIEKYQLQPSQQHHWQYNWGKVQPGQFFMLNVPSLGEAPFTFTEAPNKQGEFRAFIRKMGQVTSQLFTMQPGDILGARGPFGRGWPLNTTSSNNNTLVVAGGCGLAPLVTLIDNFVNRLIAQRAISVQTNQESIQEEKQQLVLIYGARNKGAQLLTPERARWHEHIKIFNTLDEYEENKSATTVQGSPLTVLPKALGFFTSPPTIAMLCGPEIMMKSVATSLTEYGLASNTIFLALERRMHCAVGLCGHCYINNQYVCKSGPTFSWQEYQELINISDFSTNFSSN